MKPLATHGKALVFDWGADKYETSNPAFEILQRERIEAKSKLEAIQEFFSRNSTDSYNLLRGACETTRSLIAALLSVESPDRIVLTSGTLQGVNHVLNSIIPRHSKIVLSNWEIPQLYAKLAHVYDFSCDALVQLDTSDSPSTVVKKYLDAIPLASHPNEPVCLFVSHVTYLHGILLPLADIIAASRRKNPNLLVIVDGSHAFGQINLRVEDLGSDFYVADTHKWIQASNFAGYLYVSNPEHLAKLKYEVDNIFAVSPEVGKAVPFCSKSGFQTVPAAAASIILSYFLEHASYALDNRNSFLANELRTRLASFKSRHFQIVPMNDLETTGIVALTFSNIAAFSTLNTALLDNSVKFSTFLPHRVLNDPSISHKFAGAAIPYPTIRFCVSDLFNRHDEVERLSDLIQRIEAEL